MKCIACGHNVASPLVKCPNCGYQYKPSGSRYCPNSSFGKCLLTDIMCSRGTDFQLCPTKLEADNNSF